MAPQVVIRNTFVEVIDERRKSKRRSSSLPTPDRRHNASVPANQQIMWHGYNVEDNDKTKRMNKPVNFGESSKKEPTPWHHGFSKSTTATMLQSLMYFNSKIKAAFGYEVNKVGNEMKTVAPKPPPIQALRFQHLLFGSVGTDNNDDAHTDYAIDASQPKLLSAKQHRKHLVKKVIQSAKRSMNSPTDMKQFDAIIAEHLMIMKTVIYHSDASVKGQSSNASIDTKVLECIKPLQSQNECHCPDAIRLSECGSRDGS